MQAVVESASEIDREIKLIIPHSELHEAIEKRIRDTAKNIRLDGFRPGKVPLKLVRKRFGQSIRHELASALMEKALQDALEKNSLSPIGQPQIDNLKMEEGKDLSFTAKIEIFPEVIIEMLSGIEVEQIKCSVSDNNISELIKSLQKQRANFRIESEKVIKLGDEVIISFSGKIDGIEFEGGQSDKFTLKIGDGKMIPGFEDGIIGMLSDEKKIIKVVFPDDYSASELQGKQADFDIHVIEHRVPEIPEVDEAFIKSFGVETGQEKDFVAEIKSQMERELEVVLARANKNLVFDKLLDLNRNISLPPKAVSMEIDRLKNEVIRQSGNQKLDPNTIPDGYFKDQPERNVMLGLLMRTLISSLKIEPESKRIQMIAQKMSQAYENVEDFKKGLLSDEKRYKDLEALALEDQVVEGLLKDANILFVEKNYEDVMNQQQTT